jgi:hypothetical protein
VGCSVGIAVSDGSQRNIGVTVCGIDGIYGGDRERVADVRHDSKYPNLSALLENIGHADSGGVVPP